MNRQFSNNAKKVGCIISVACLTFSMTGCLNFLKKAKTTENYDAVMEAIEKGDFVEEWKKDVPEGMEVRYLVTKMMHVNSSDSYYENLYKFDSYERCTYFTEVYENGYKQYENIYDANGNLIAKKQKHEGNVPATSMGFVDAEYEYTYNADGQMLSYTETSEHKDDEYILHYDDGGHLTGVTKGDKEIYTFDVNFDAEPYSETVAVLSDAIGDDYLPSYVTRCYDAEGTILSELNGDHLTTYQYENGVVVSSTTTTEKGYAAVDDADGNRLSYRIELGDDFEAAEFQYNEHKDLILNELSGKNGVKKRVTYTYEYDKNGNKTSQTQETWTTDSKGKESTSVYTTKYTCDEHGLLVTEEKKSGDGSFVELSVYYYKAVLVYV